MNNIAYKQFLQDIINNNISKVKRAINSGMDVNAHNSYPLHLVCQYGQVELVNILLDSGANINAYNNYYTPLTNSIEHKQFHIIDLLIERGADLQAYNEAALIMLCRINKLDYVKLFIEKGSYVDANNSCCLHIAGELGYTDLVAYLMTKSKNSKEWPYTFLSCANKGLFETASIFLKHGVDANLLDTYGNEQSKHWLKEQKAQQLAKDFDKQLDNKLAPSKVNKSKI